ncbi:MAG: DNA cytosine methyltransferase [Lentimicrobium sp.]|jgi:DNA (cytosine-5)-methyltransferase 1|nr:DNA cytosine methyltransferase [Lentimicrobium sp.]
MNHASLFSGIGGFDLAAEWMGWENVFHCEINPFGQKVLKYYWPNAIAYDDITKTDFTIHKGRIDILTGGFPCQPFSLAGKRLGTADDRNLWPEYYRAIKEIQPTWVVGENVPGLINWSNGMVFEQVQTDLENEGYEVWPVILPAAGVNAPHRRDRVWFVAYSNLYGHKLREFNENRSTERESKSKKNQWERVWNVSWRAGESRDAANTTSQGRKEWEQNSGRTNTEEIKSGMELRPERLRSDENAPNPSNKQLQGGKFDRSVKSERQTKTESRQFSGSVCGKWEQFPTQSPICSGNDGFSSRLDGITFPKWRNESIKAYGNAIVPQVAFQIFKAIEEFNTSHHGKRTSNRNR